MPEWWHHYQFVNSVHAAHLDGVAYVDALDAIADAALQPGWWDLLPYVDDEEDAM